MGKVWVCNAVLLARFKVYHTSVKYMCSVWANLQETQWVIKKKIITFTARWSVHRQCGWWVFAGKMKCDCTIVFHKWGLIVKWKVIFLFSNYENPWTGMIYCPILLILISKVCYKLLVLSEVYKGEDLRSKPLQIRLQKNLQVSGISAQ